MIEHVEIVEGDIRDPAIVRKAMEDIESVAHLAYVNGTEYFYKYPDFVLDVAVKGMVNVIDAAIVNDVPEFVLMSSSEVYQTPPTIPTDETVPLSVPDITNPRYSYGGGKILCELMAMNYGREHFERVLIVRPHNVFGPAMGYEHVIPQFIARLQSLMNAEKRDVYDFLIQGDGLQKRSFIFIDDFTAGFLNVLEKGAHLGVYHIGTMEEMTIGELAEAIAGLMGVRITIKSGEEAKGSTLQRCPDNGKLRALGWQPTVAMPDALERTIAWYRANPAPSGSGLKGEPLLFLPA
jgi:nucleoside-diphosphate-sugar epimerase